MELPSETTKNSFAQLVAVAGGLCAVVVGTIALDAEEIAPRGSGVDHGKVDSVPGTTYLLVNVPTPLN